MTEWKRMAGMLSGLINVGSVEYQQYHSLIHKKIFKATLRYAFILKSQVKIICITVHTVAEIGVFVPWESGVLGLTQVFIDLTPQIFNNSNKFLQKKTHWVVDFYSPWCGSCQNFAPEFELLARMIKQKEKHGEVHCQASPQACQKVGIKTYPSVGFCYYERTNKESNLGRANRFQWCKNYCSLNWKFS